MSMFFKGAASAEVVEAFKLIGANCKDAAIVGGTGGEWRVGESEGGAIVTTIHNHPSIRESNIEIMLKDKIARIAESGT